MRTEKFVPGNTRRAALAIVAIIASFLGGLASRAQTTNLVGIYDLSILQAHSEFTTPVLASGKQYFFKVSGRWGGGPLDRGDSMTDAAYAAYRGNDGNWGPLDVNRYPTSPFKIDGVPIGRPTPDEYRTDHVYVYILTSQDRAITVSFDDDPIWDNVGGPIHVELYMVETTTPPVGPAHGFEFAFAGGLGSGGGSANWADIDDDGDDDLFIGGYNGSSRLFRNDGGGNLVDITGGGALALNLTMVPCFGDYDNDGLEDLMVTHWDWKSHYLFHQEDSGAMTVVSGIPAPDHAGQPVGPVNWVDWDNDGNLDFLITCGASPHLLYRGNGSGGFTRETAPAFLSFSGGFGGGPGSWPIDVDGDRDTDLVIATTQSEYSLALYLNDGDFAFHQNTDDGITGQPSGTLLSWADFDNDGYLDAFTSDVASNFVVYYNLGQGRFAKTIMPALTVSDTSLWRSSTAADFDNDGDVDVLVSLFRETQPLVALLENLGNRQWALIQEMACANGSLDIHGHSDYDGDGDVDAVITRPWNGATEILENQGNTNKWLKIKCVGVQSNRSAIGTTVRLKARIAGEDRWQMRQVTARSGWRGHDSRILHFGLGDAAEAEVIRIEWPSGISQEIYKPAANQLLRIVETNTTWLTNGLVAYYPFNGNANDESGNGHHGTLHGGIEFVSGSPHGTACKFNGTDSTVALGNWFNFFPFTIGLWVKPSNKPWQVIMDNNHSGLNNWVVQSFGDGNCFGWFNSTCDTVATNQWSHLIIRYEGESGHCSTFLNGVLVEDGTQIRNYNNGPNLTLGNWWHADRAYQGELDEIRMYNRALSDDEIQQLYAFESKSPPLAPQITVQPESQVVQEGTNVNLSVTVTGTPPFSFQWFKDAVDLPGATNDTLTITNVQPRDLGYYSVVVTNAAGSVTSSNAMVSIQGLPFELWQGLVAYYPFNGNANDESGGGRDGVVLAASGVVLAPDRFQEAERAYRFDGDNSQVRSIRVAPDLLNTGQQEYTISLWCATADPAKEQSIVNTDPHPGLAISIANRRTTPGALGAGYHVGSGESGWSEWRPASSFGWDRDGWYHVVFTKKATQYRLYLDGVNKDIFDLPQAATFDRNLSGLLLGSPAPASFPEATWYGSLDDIRIYNRALSETEVQQLYVLESPPHVPEITVQPESQVVQEGTNVTLSVTVTGTPPFSYQWTKDAVGLQGATNATLGITNVQPHDIGYYSVAVTNVAGSVTSSNAMVSIQGLPFELWQGIVAYYPFNGNANDASGNGANGTVSGANLSQDRFGVANSAYAFNGGTDSVVLTNLSVNTQPGQYTTVSFWMKWGGSFYAPADPGGFVFGWNNSGGIYHYGGAVDPHPSPPILGLMGDLNGAQYGTYVSSNSLKRWVHVVAKFNNGDVKSGALYTNGIAITSSAYTSGFPSAGTFQTQVTPIAWISGYGASSDRYRFVGSIDDVRIYNRALSDSEVQELYDLERPRLGDGLVAYYPFNGNANDESGNKNDGAVILAQPGSDRFGSPNSAYYFDGSNAYIDVASSHSLAFGDAITATAWIAPELLYPPQGQEGFRAMEIVGKGVDVEGALDWAFSVNGNILRSHFMLGTWTYFDAPHGLQAKTWQHVAFNFDGTMMRIFLNGVQTGQQPASGAFRISEGSMRIGAYAPINGTGSKLFFLGNIDDIRIYNRALSPFEVQQLYALESTPPEFLVPKITVQPASQTVRAGENVTLSVTVAGTPPFGCQWLKDDVGIPGATNDTLSISNVAPSDMGYYWVVVTNSNGSATSDAASLTVEGFEFDVWQGLLAHYTFDGNPNDVSGNEHHGAVTGTGLTYPADRFGVANAALEAAGTGGAIQIPTLAGAGPTTSNAFSMTFWARRNTFGSVLTKFLNGSAAGSDFAVWLSGGAINVTGDGLDYLATGYSPANEWTHFCVSIGPGTNGVKVWADGVLLNESAVTLNGQVSTTGMLIGRLNGFPDNPLFGAIDDLRLYGRALTDSDAGKIFSIDSEPAVPLIAVQPEDQIVRLGEPVRFEIAAYSPSAVTCQWHGPAGVLSGQTNSILTWPAAAASDAGPYWAVLANPYGSVTSRVATLTVAIPPSIAQSPASATLLEGNPLALSVTATGSEPLHYQWFKDGAALSGATNPAFGRAEARLEDAGVYSITVTNAYGSATSSNAVVRVVERTEYRLNVVRGGGGGLVMTDPFLQNYSTNAVVECTALPAGGWTFLDWLGDLEGTNPVVSLTMNADKCVQARFGAELMLLEPVHGTFEVIPQAGLYPAGYPVQFRALPDPGYYFAQWTGSEEALFNPGYYAIDSAWMVVGAVFLPLGTNEVSLTVWPEGQGDVEFDPLDNRFPMGSTVQLTARPRDGQAFLGWETDAGGIENPLTVAMDRSKLIRARFTSAPRLDAVVCSGPLHDGSALLLLTGEWGRGYQIEASTNMFDWAVLTVLTNTWGTTQFRDPTALDSVPRFYRAQEVIAIPAGMALIPAGPFEMGDTFAEGNSDERPVHTVYVSAFYMDQSEVTKAQWDLVYQWAIEHGYSFQSPGYGKAADHPVHSLNWYDAVKWCNARSEREGRVPAFYTDAGQTTVYRSGNVDVASEWVKWDAGYRLPTEAEWEKAARGKLVGRRFPWGDTITHNEANYYSHGNPAEEPYDLATEARYHPDYDSGEYPYTSPVGSFVSNRYGLCDMAGNLWEYCWDWFGGEYYAASPGSNPRGPGAGTDRVVRGGSWDPSAKKCRVADRAYDPPTYGFHNLGFRTVLPPDWVSEFIGMRNLLVK